MYNAASSGSLSVSGQLVILVSINKRVYSADTVNAVFKCDSFSYCDRQRLERAVFKRKSSLALSSPVVSNGYTSKCSGTTILV